MKWLTYINYFLYIAWNWNFRLAFFSVSHEIRGEKKYGINTSGLDDLQSLTINSQNRMHAEIYQGAGYFLLETLFEQLKKRKAPDGFLDAGCGKGRALVVAAHYGFRRITGVDFAEELCTIARINCRRISETFPTAKWKVINADAAGFEVPGDIHVLFLFNPFREEVMQKVVANICGSLRRKPREFYVAYINPQRKDIFLQQGFREVFHIKKMDFVEACLLKK